MRTPPRILDRRRHADERRHPADPPGRHGYDIVTAADGEEALAAARETLPDLILLDVMMPKLDGIEVCRRLKADPSLPFIPIIMVTAKADPKDIVAGLEAGGDEYLTKPVDQAALVARVKSMLRIKALHDTVQAPRRGARRVEPDARAARRGAGRPARALGRLKRFFSPQLAELIVSGGADDPLETHRREVTVVFLDLRGFTAFAETAEPEEVMGVLREYHAAMGTLILEHEGTLERFTGDGMMIFFNDPVPVPDPAERAIRMALAMRERVRHLVAVGRSAATTSPSAIGIAQGYATIGAIGFEGRWDYGAIGTVTNLAARLCGEAQGGQILVSSRVAAALDELIDVEEVGTLTLRGFLKPVRTFNALGLRALERG